MALLSYEFMRRAFLAAIFIAGGGFRVLPQFEPGSNHLAYRGDRSYHPGIFANIISKLFGNIDCYFNVRRVSPCTGLNES